MAWFNLFKMRKRKGTSLEEICVVLALKIKKGMFFLIHITRLRFDSDINFGQLLVI